MSIIITFWEYIKIFSVSLHKLFSSEFIFSSTSLIISLLIPIAIMLLGSKKGSNPIENRWAQKVLKKQIIHFKDVLNYIIIILILLMVNQLFPQLTVFTASAFLICIYYLICLIHKYIEWIDIDGLGNRLAINEQKELLISSKYSLNEQAFYWQLFIDYSCSQDKNSPLFNPNTFYKVWEQASKNYKEQSSYRFYSFCYLLASNIPKLKLNYDSAFDEEFYKHCIEHYIKEVDSKRNWHVLVNAQTLYVEKDSSKSVDSFAYYRLVNTLNELVNDNLSDDRALNYINMQFMRCLLACKNPYNKELKNTNFQIRSKNFFDNHTGTFHQTISLMKQFIKCVRKHKYHYSMDASINMLFSKADGITIGRLDYLIVCICKTFNSYGANQNLAIIIFNIVSDAPKFGKISVSPNEETDISNLSSKELIEARRESYQESIKIYAYFYKINGSINLFKEYLKEIINVMTSNAYIEMISEKENTRYLSGISKVYKDILTDFLKCLNY
ncbi:hypothetical protein HUK45_08260 [Limosilactobacillus sp. c9Ua_26_M]|uniref:Uncharacterized protein n=1 Tax=Limosilactobacillus urinaemulieris TaxID=2742600 RepID=A0ABR8ZMV0_9LACO|nr:hypothetical protein [Limosilactobacillus urinaemulieris]MBD8086218.1 hypothetical protein [Limosilactobacillus urinaemulieris]